MVAVVQTVWYLLPPRKEKEAKSKIGFESWLRLPWLSITPHREPPTQISKIWGIFGHMVIFWAKNRVFLVVRRASGTTLKF